MLGMAVAWFCIQGIYKWDGHKPVNAIAEGQCTNDAILQETFGEMKQYLGQSKSETRKIFMYVFLALIVVLNLAGLGFKIGVLDKDTKKSQKKDQLNEPILKK